MVKGFNLGVGVFCFIQMAIYFYLANKESENRAFNYIVSFVVGIAGVINFMFAYG